jgi:16S rRNA G966 N2-methylase RsmD
VEKNQLYYGDNLEVLRQHIKDESVDLIYLDPPFNSRQDYNVLFAETDGTRSSSQIMAFEEPRSRTCQPVPSANPNYTQKTGAPLFRVLCGRVGGENARTAKPT